MIAVLLDPVNYHFSIYALPTRAHAGRDTNSRTSA